MAGSATISLTSPSRTALTFTNSLTDNGSGYFSFTLDYSDTSQLEDDTYKYELTQNGNYLKTGYIRFLEGEVTDGILDCVLNTLLA